VNPASTRLALACEDGAVRLLSLEHGALEHAVRFDRAKGRLLSVAWGPPVPPAPRADPPRGEGNTGGDSDSDDDDDDDWMDEWLVTGGADSALRRWDVRTGRATDRMVTDKARGERTLVWTVGVLGCAPSLRSRRDGRADRPQGRHDHLGRLARHGQILGCAHAHAAPEFRCARRGRALYGHQRCKPACTHTLCTPV
jgi:hypothetical protein